MALPARAGIYCRLSYAPDGSLENVEAQEADCREMAARLGWPISDAHVYHDNSRSAWQRSRRRPAWDRMLSDIEAGEIDSIIVYHGDRLIRQPYDLEKLISIGDQRGIRIASVSGTRDLDSSDDRFVLRIEAAQACRASDDTSRRVKRGWAKRAAAGRPIGGGKRPFGFEPDMVTRRESECALLVQAAEMLLAVRRQGPVIRWLHAQGSTTSQGNAWTPVALRHLLTGPRIAGLVEHQGTHHTAVWEPIISREMWEEVRAYYAQSAADNPYVGRERQHMLSGVALCGLCDTAVHAKPSGGRNRKTSRIYYCRTPGCRGVGRNVDLLDAYVSGRTLRLLGDSRFAAALQADAEAPGVGAEIAALEARRESTRGTLEELADHPDADPALLTRALASFDRRIGELRQQAAAGARERLLLRMAGISREAWEDEPVEVKARTVAALWRIRILKTSRRGPGFDPDGVEMRRLRTT